MSPSTNKALVKSYVEEVFNNHDISANEKYLAGNEKFQKIQIITINSVPHGVS